MIRRGGNNMGKGKPGIKVYIGLFSHQNLPVSDHTSNLWTREPEARNGGAKRDIAAFLRRFEEYRVAVFRRGYLLFR